MQNGTGRKRGSKDGAKGSVEDGWQNGRIIFVGRNSLEVAIPRRWRVAVNLWGRFSPIATLRALPATWLIHSTWEHRLHPTHHPSLFLFGFYLVLLSSPPLIFPYSPNIILILSSLSGSIESDEDVVSFSLPPNSPSNLFDLPLW